MGIVRWVNGQADRSVETTGWRGYPRSARIRYMFLPVIAGFVAGLAIYAILDLPAMTFVAWVVLATATGLFGWALVIESRTLMRVAVWVLFPILAMGLVFPVIHFLD